MKCENCKKESDYIKNFVITYQSWEAYNCCCKECAKERINSDMGITGDEVINIE